MGLKAWKTSRKRRFRSFSGQSLGRRAVSRLRKGKIEFEAPSHGAEAVSFYRVYLADEKQKLVEGYEWKLEAAKEMSLDAIFIDVNGSSCLFYK